MTGPQMTTIRFAFMIAWITRARWVTEFAGGTRKAGKDGRGDEGSKGKKTVILCVEQDIQTLSIKHTTAFPRIQLQF